MPEKASKEKRKETAAREIKRKVMTTASENEQERSKEGLRHRRERI